MTDPWPKFWTTTEEWFYFRYGLDMTKPDLRRSKQPTPELQRAVNDRKKRVNKLLSDIKQGKREKEIIIRGRGKKTSNK